MIYFTILIIIILCFAIIKLIRNEHKSKKMFQEKINFLENIILDLNQNLNNQNQKVKLLDDLKFNLNQSNKKIGTAIAEMNYEIFDEMFNRK